MTNFKIAPFGGWENCAWLENGALELIVTLDVGPRIIHCAPAGGKNLFYVDKADKGKTGGDKFRLYGGHRLWHAPEMKPRTYAPDNAPVEHKWDGATLRLTAPVEPLTGIQKQISITPNASAATVKIEHSLTNTGVWDIKTAPWSLTNLAPGGHVILPQEPFVPFPDCLLPARPLVLWTYTKMADSRFTWQDEYFAMRQDPLNSEPQKVGIRNSRNWGAYHHNGTIFIKQTALDAEATYPDFGCNWETYINANFAELETLGPLQTLAAMGGVAKHLETWHVHATTSAKIDAVYREIAQMMDAGEQ